MTDAWGRGIENIVALRGDPPKGETAFRPVAGGLPYANELVSLIRREFPQFGVAVAGYPETHREAPSPETDLENLKRKVDAGADVVITQLFYDNGDFFGFRDRCQRLDIRVPIVPGILPVTNLAQIQRIASLCGARLPEEFVQALSDHQDDADQQFQVGVQFATRQVQELLDAGVPGMHFYVLNKSQATAEYFAACAWERRLKEERSNGVMELWSEGGITPLLHYSIAPFCHGDTPCKPRKSSFPPTSRMPATRPWIMPPRWLARTTPRC